MGYLRSNIVEIDCILTKLGRSILSKNPEKFKITKFALSDDEIDYRLWNPDHTLGSDYYGEVIEEMPILEASPNEDQIMKFKLITMDKESNAVPSITVSPAYAPLQSGTADFITISPVTLNIANGNSVEGYTATLSDSTIATLEVPADKTVGTLVPRDKTTWRKTVDEATTVTRVGFTFLLKPKTVQSDYSGTVKVTGNETGGTATVQFDVKAVV